MVAWGDTLRDGLTRGDCRFDRRGGSQVDLNNANVRAYLKMPGMYPAVAGKIVSNGPYSSVGDIYNIAGLTSREKDVLKKYESKFVALKPSADFVIDR